MKIYLGNIKDYSIEELKRLVSHKRVLETERYVHEEDRKRGLMAAALLNYGLKKDKELYFKGSSEMTAGSNKYDELMIKDEYQKPHIKINDRELLFSFSHSGDYGVCAIGGFEEKDRLLRLGVDIESYEGEGKEKSMDSIAKRFFTRQEYEYVVGDKEDTLKRFYRIWTLKEAYIKAEGLGLSIPLDSFSVTVKEGDNTADYSAKEVYRGRYFEDIEGYLISVCTLGSENNLNIMLDNVKDLI
ncbi:MAG: 4'-phosphopantetheinyl transferase superfamily protein [Lachnospiraceae bacterium]|nr:4'-phosphopantetheinyl transferase superfamily protein [Lachnospiraceae bacterium]